MRKTIDTHHGVVISDEPIRLQLCRKKGFSLQGLSQAINGKEVVNCARPSRCGNPFHHHSNGTPMSAAEAETHFRAQLVRLGWFVNEHGQTITTQWIRDNLKGKNLACFCKVDAEHCHVNVLLEVANS